MYRVSCIHVHTRNFLNTRKYIHEIFNTNSSFEKSFIIILTHLSNIKLEQFHAIKIISQCILYMRQDSIYKQEWKLRIVQIIKPKENTQCNLILTKSNSSLKSLPHNSQSSFGSLY